MKKRFFLLFLSVIILIPLHGEKAVEIKAVRIKNPPRIDGKLDDTTWQKALSYTKFKMIEPKANSEPSEKTELKIVYDDKNIYFGIMCYDSEPSRIIANTMEFDKKIDEHLSEKGEVNINDDLIKILIDPFKNKRTAYVFFINPKGARSDGLANDKSYSLNWDGIWEGKAKILKNGWSAEIKIPFKTLLFNPKLHSWGINVERVIARKWEIIRLSGFSHDLLFYNPAIAANMEGIKDIKQGKGLTIKPYISFDTEKDLSINPEREYGYTGGFDLYKNFTPNLVGVFSYNTDFAETEVDDRRINVSRFPLFFPEKRGFFLEGSDIFKFGSTIGPTLIPFFSRKIGLSEGKQIPVLFGTKLFGRIKDTNIAVLDVKTRDFEDNPSKNFIAGRVYQNIFEQSKIGIIFTDGDPNSTDLNRLLGFDFVYSTSKFLKNKNLEMGLWWLYNWNKLEGDHKSYGLKIDYPNDLIASQFTYLYLGEGFSPGLAFMLREQRKFLSYTFNYKPRPQKGIAGKYARQLFFTFNTVFYLMLDGQIESWTTTITPLNINFKGGEKFMFSIENYVDNLFSDFNMTEDISIPAAKYNFVHYRFEYDTAPYKKLYLKFACKTGKYYTGKIDVVVTSLHYRIDGTLNLSLFLDYVNTNLKEGNFKGIVYRAKADIFFSPDIALLNYFQYDNVSKNLGANIRFSWRISPGNKLYFTLNKNWGKIWDPAERFISQYDKFVFKVVLSIRP